MWNVALFILNNLSVHIILWIVCPHWKYQLLPLPWYLFSNDLCSSALSSNLWLHINLQLLTSDNAPINSLWTKSSTALYIYFCVQEAVSLDRKIKRSQFPFHVDNSEKALVYIHTSRNIFFLVCLISICSSKGYVKHFLLSSL